MTGFAGTRQVDYPVEFHVSDRTGSGPNPASESKADHEGQGALYYLLGEFSVCARSKIAKMTDAHAYKRNALITQLTQVITIK